ncbi:hypothetical protein NCER_100990 [Vairimorpha ceranae BRL01]|uniref:Uncharacterized protein n=2 Tax=Vairimorpha ceranae TaxID=40302 RepID=C4V8Y3_VAIC1|nr:3-ketodihydrosphingosine reductase [Vairimorpha ceranae]EEQ82323.1 hypothetical protein NCER_100990 [Vairimorpha ceranae BRL01]KAF5141663.1 hypothetical protein G9O61_00g002050 [Vairimorpha ceranae]KKO76658.1 3-ketodihydrosphingosine reductase [Vairimorpha ceranae]
MLKMFKKQVQNKPKNFKFCKSGFILSSETLNEYEYIKKLFFISVSIFTRTTSKSNGIEEIKRLLLFYEKSDTLMCSLIDEFFSKRFIESIDRRYALFEILDKILRMFYVFDKLRLKAVKPFHNFSFFKIKNRSCISEREIIKLSTFASIAMPMARLFISYFSAEDFEIFHPMILKKRTTLFIGDTKKGYLKYICAILVEHTKLKYLKIFMCALYEKLNKDSTFDIFYEQLNSKEQEYFIDLVNLL